MNCIRYCMWQKLCIKGLYLYECVWRIKPNNSAAGAVCLNSNDEPVGVVGADSVSIWNLGISDGKICLTYFPKTYTQTVFMCHWYSNDFLSLRKMHMWGKNDLLRLFSFNVFLIISCYHFIIPSIPQNNMFLISSHLNIYLIECVILHIWNGFIVVAYRGKTI